MGKKEEERLADLSVILSFAAVVLAALDALGYTIFLAATQWLLVAAVLMLWAIYIHIKD